MMKMIRNIIGKKKHQNDFGNARVAISLIFWFANIYRASSSAEQNLERMPTLARLRSVHIMDMAVFDWLATMIGAIVLASVFSSEHVVGIFILLIVTAIVAHWAFGIPTMLNAYLGLAKKEDVYAKRVLSNQSS
jgi:hypothetical protein